MFAARQTAAWGHLMDSITPPHALLNRYNPGPALRYAICQSEADDGAVASYADAPKLLVCSKDFIHACMMCSFKSQGYITLQACRSSIHHVNLCLLLCPYCACLLTDNVLPFTESAFGCIQLLGGQSTALVPRARGCLPL